LSDAAGTAVIMTVDPDPGEQRLERKRRGDEFDIHVEGDGDNVSYERAVIMLQTRAFSMRPSSAVTTGSGATAPTRPSPSPQSQRCVLRHQTDDLTASLCVTRRRYCAGVGPTASRNARWKCGWSL